MRDLNIKELLKLYEEGKATAQQRELVEKFLEWYQEQGQKKELAEEGLQEIMERVRASREEAPVYEMEVEPRRTRRPVWAAAAAVMVLALGAWLWKMNGRRPEAPQVASVYKTVAAKPGQSIHLLLSDSSEVWLNAGARIRYRQPFGDSMRRVELMDGEAYFQIHSDASRGFEVAAGRMVTKVLGTSFNVKAYRQSQQMSVSVSSGKVAVSAGSDQGMVFTAGQMARYNTATGSVSRGTVAVEKIENWKGGRFDFTAESLGDIAIELEHYYNVTIAFKYPGLRKYPVSASFAHQTPLIDILHTLCLLNQNHVTQTDAQHYVIH
jgi:ferric-dicitrate binding protein FerR (iron transport regulator)